MIASVTQPFAAAALGRACRPTASSPPACFRRRARLAGPAAPGRQQRRAPRGAGQDLAGAWRPQTRAARRPAGPAGLGRDVLHRRVTLAPGRPPQRRLAVAPLTCPPGPAYVGWWAGLPAVGDPVVGDEDEVAHRGAEVGRPPGEPSGSSPSVNKAALAAVSSSRWAGTDPADLGVTALPCAFSLSGCALPSLVDLGRLVTPANPGPRRLTTSPGSPALATPVPFPRRHRGRLTCWLVGRVLGE